MTTKEEYYRQVEVEVLSKFLASDRVYQAITLHSFLSYSKGRNRKRKCPKEIELVRYNDGFHLAKNFKWDIYATEILGDIDNAEAELREAVLGCQTCDLSHNYAIPV